MSESLASTLARLSLNSQGLSGPAFDARIAEEAKGTYENHQPRKKTRQSPDDIKAEVEAEFLSPSPRFGSEWLNRLQRSFHLILPAQTRLLLTATQEMGCPCRLCGSL